MATSTSARRSMPARSPSGRRSPTGEPPRRTWTWSCRLRGSWERAFIRRRGRAEAVQESPQRISRLLGGRDHPVGVGLEPLEQFPFPGPVQLVGFGVDFPERGAVPGRELVAGHERGGLAGRYLGRLRLVGIERDEPLGRRAMPGGLIESLEQSLGGLGNGSRLQLVSLQAQGAGKTDKQLEIRLWTAFFVDQVLQQHPAVGRGIQL